METRNAVPDFGTGPDLETFQRVWSRVMPDETHSPIVVKPPQSSPPRPQPMPPQNNSPRPEPVPGQGTPPRPQPMPPKESSRRSEEKASDSMSMKIERMIQTMCEGIGNLTGTTAPNGSVPVFSMLENQRKQNLRRLGAFYFLNTGRTITCRPTGKRQKGSVAQLLRQQYVWEQNWERQCNQWEEESQNWEFLQLCRSLSLQAQERRQHIWEALERLDPYGTQGR